MPGRDLTNRLSVLKKIHREKSSAAGGKGDSGLSGRPDIPETTEQSGCPDIPKTTEQSGYPDIPETTEQSGCLNTSGSSGPHGSPGLSGWKQLGEFLYRRREYISGSIGPAPAGRMGLKDFDRQPELLFYDTETTGLSSGTGTFIFLLGMAWVEQSTHVERDIEGRGSSDNGGVPRIVLEQVFAADYPGEPEFLSYIGKQFKEHNIFVSFNGKSYDSHLLKTRFLMNGMDFEPGEQYDLLHISRRLWGRLIGKCSLSNIEEKILGIHRNGDIPGYEVPERYFSFLRTGNAGLLTDVFRHNRQDVISMVILLNVIEKILSGEKSGPVFDHTSLGAYLLKGNNPQSAALGEKHLNRGFAEGDARAGRFLSLMHKRKGQWEKAIEIWYKMAGKKSLFAVTELAKYYEHKKRDYESALAWVDKCLLWNIPLSTGDRFEISRRKKRLIIKIKNSKFENRS